MGFTMKTWLLMSATCIAALGITTNFFYAKAEKMDAILVDLGKNIHETAKASGAPRFSVESHWGVKIYELLDLPPALSVRFNRTGNNIIVNSLYSLTMYADSDNNNNLGVERVELSFYPSTVKTHQEAQALVSGVIAQFNQGKWRRYIYPTCPAITGRSVYLDIDGKVTGVCSLDPNYKMAMQDWLTLMPMTQRYEWLADEVLASLIVRFSNDSRGLRYTIDLEFQDITIQNRRYAALEAKELVEGDKKGWNSTAKHIEEMKKNKIDVKALEDNATARGDKLIPRH